MTTTRRKRCRPTVAPQPEPIIVDVQAVTNFAFNAGLTIELAQELLLDAEMEDCRVISGVCREHCNDTASFLIALRAFGDRDVIYCEGCNVADVGV